MAYRNGCAAEQPRLELIAGWAIGAFVIEQRQPCLLLAFRCEGQMAHRVHVDLTAAIEGADARQQIAERKDALHRRRLEPERVGNLVHAATGFDQRHKRFPLADLRSEENTSELQSLLRTSYAV